MTDFSGWQCVRRRRFGLQMVLACLGRRPRHSILVCPDGHVTHHLKKLEHHFGASLFERGPRGIRLTAEGECKSWSRPGHYCGKFARPVSVSMHAASREITRHAIMYQAGAITLPVTLINQAATS